MKKQIGFNVDDSKIKEVTKQFQKIDDIMQQIAANAKLAGNEEDKWLKKANKLYSKQNDFLKTKIDSNKKLYKLMEKETKKQKIDNFKKEHPYLYKGGKNLDNQMVKIANKIAGFFKSVWSGIVSNIKEMMSEKGVASYNMGTSLFTNAQARQMSMKYGLGAGQTYALDQSMKMLGMQNDEDLMYMNTAQKAKFNELMTKYSAWYDQMEQSGFLQNVQEAQLELKMFKQEVAMKFMNWFAQNKDTIMAVIKGTLKVLEVLANAIFSVLKIFGVGSNASSSSALSTEQLNNATTNNNNLMNINNTVNANVTTSNQADAQNFGKDVASGAIRLYSQMVNTL